MNSENKQLIEELLSKTERAIAIAFAFKELSDEQLNFKTGINKWSILECLEHLNLYGDFYLQKIEEQILLQKTSINPPIFKSAMLGNYFANMILVKKGNVKKYKAMKRMTPQQQVLTNTTIERFLRQQELLKTLLGQCQCINLNKSKIPTALSNYLKLSLGDTLRFLVYHNERHIFQAENILNAMPCE